MCTRVGGFRFTLPSVLACMFLVLAIWAASASASATPGPPSVPGPTGIPDGRVYEQVTPTFKNGNAYGIGTSSLFNLTFGLASADGNAAVFPMTGPVGVASSGLIADFVSRRTPAHGWQTVSVTSHPTAAGDIFSAPLALVPSADFKRFAFVSSTSFVADDPQVVGHSGVNIFLGEDPFAEPEWLGRPGMSSTVPVVGSIEVNKYFIAGQSPDLKTVYFTFYGTLTPEDASRTHNVELTSPTGRREAGNRADNPWGFYEWSDGRLVSGGALPDGTFSPFGAVPAAIAGNASFFRGPAAIQAETMDNEVSEDGTRAFFVSPDPNASTVSSPEPCSAEPPCSHEPPELYLRKPGASGEKVSVLISASMLPGHEGEAAPDGIVSMPEAASAREGGATDMYASPDGSHALFASRDQLTAAAPSDEQVKIYDYDVETGSLTYLPGVTGPIVTVSHDGSEVLFEDTEGTPRRLLLWRDGVGGGRITTIAELPYSGIGYVNMNNVHVSEDGTVILFRTNGVIPGGFNNGGEFNQIYRYDLGANELNCVSCPPVGISPSGPARTSYNNHEEGKPNGYNSDPLTTIDTRAMSVDDSRVFFDTPDALVPQDINGVRDVYEWVNGTVYLISSGSNPEQSVYLDNDKFGENVFFATSAALVPGDTGEDYDVYDARIPRPGDNLPLATPCKGSVCQGPPSVPQLLGLPASETFTGAGNVVLPSEASSKVKPKKKPKAKKKAKKRRRGGKPRKKAGVAKSIGAHGASKRVTHRNGRGK